MTSVIFRDSGPVITPADGSGPEVIVRPGRCRGVLLLGPDVQPSFPILALAATAVIISMVGRESPESVRVRKRFRADRALAARKFNRVGPEFPDLAQFLVEADPAGLEPKILPVVGPEQIPLHAGADHQMVEDPADPVAKRPPDEDLNRSRRHVAADAVMDKDAVNRPARLILGKGLNPSLLFQGAHDRADGGPVDQKLERRAANASNENCPLRDLF